MTGLIRRGFFVAGAISLALLSATTTLAETGSLRLQNTKSRVPDRRQGSSSRCGGCQGQPGLFALVPESNASNTLQAYPSFSWYVPETSGGEALTFVLTQYDRIENRQEPLFEKSFQMDGSSGVMKLSLADVENAPALAGDEEYVWFAVIYCNPQDLSKAHVLESTVVRVESELDFIAQMQQAHTPLSQARLYESHGFWPDALDLLLQERIIKADSPLDKRIVEARLEELLTSAGLEQFAEQPMMQTYEQPGHNYQPLEGRPSTWVSSNKQPPKIAAITRWAGCGGGSPAKPPVYADS